MNRERSYLYLIGEPLPRILAGELLACLGAHTQLLNTYGVTETTLDCTYRRVFDVDTLPSVSTAFVPIGLPLPNYVCHIRGETAEQQDGIGELYIGGPGVFRGYLNHGTNLADSRLVEVDGKICYRTGDLVKIINGELAYVGRRDFQVKIRGMNITFKVSCFDYIVLFLRSTCRNRRNRGDYIARISKTVKCMSCRGEGRSVDCVCSNSRT